MKLLNRILKPETVYAHCDIPCGIYDPHLAQVAAHTVIRMVNLINNLPNLTDIENAHKFSRYISTKEEHAELVKHEIRVIWGDFIKPEHLEKFPEISDLVTKIMQLGSKVRQEINLEASTDLLKTVQKFAEIFWKLKGLEPVYTDAPYAGAGKEIVIHK
ncbi:MAG: superoxide dismutase, Ni [Candidatus Hodarchaeales archaeon]|jgi:nickel superoxide dismutase